MTPVIRMTWPMMHRNTVEVRGVGVRLFPAEITVLTTLLLRRGQIVDRETLLEALWPDPDDMPEWCVNIVSVYITRLRRALGADLIAVLNGRGILIPTEEELQRRLAA